MFCHCSANVLINIKGCGILLLFFVISVNLQDDNERTQITTEIEAVQKVIGDNIEASYKTFSG